MIMNSQNHGGRPAGITGQARTFTEKELKRVLLLVECGNNARRNSCIVVFSHFLGLRAKELSALKLSDVLTGVGVKKTLRLVAAYTKGAKHRDISLENPKVVKVLSEYLCERKARDGAIFSLNAPLFRSQKGSAFSPNAMCRVLIDIYAGAGFENASSHSGRRSLITRLACSGVDVNSIRLIAGHSSIATTQRYIESNPRVLADILKSL